MAGRYTKTGNANQAAGEPLFDGTNNTWVKEEIDLEQFAGQHILIRFTLISDGGVVADGFYFDDVTISIVDFTTEIKDKGNQPETITLSSPVPNPASTSATISYFLPFKAGQSQVVFYASDGKIVKVCPASAGNHEMRIDILAWPAGVYYYRLITSAGNNVAKKLIVTGSSNRKF